LIHVCRQQGIRRRWIIGRCVWSIVLIVVLKTMVGLKIRDSGTQNNFSRFFPFVHLILGMLYATHSLSKRRFVKNTPFKSFVSELPRINHSPPLSCLSLLCMHLKLEPIIYNKIRLHQTPCKSYLKSHYFKMVHQNCDSFHKTFKTDPTNRGFSSVMSCMRKNLSLSQLITCMFFELHFMYFRTWVDISDGKKQISVTQNQFHISLYKVVSTNKYMP
jgi:hypothetical protein